MFLHASSYFFSFLDHIFFFPSVIDIFFKPSSNVEAWRFSFRVEIEKNQLKRIVLRFDFRLKNKLIRMRERIIEYFEILKIFNYVKLRYKFLKLVAPNSLVLKSQNYYIMCSFFTLKCLHDVKVKLVAFYVFYSTQTSCSF